MSSFSFEIKDGNVIGREWLWNAVKRLFQTLPDGQYAWKHPAIKRNLRSLKQNAYYWGVVVEICSKHTGYTDKEMHQIFGEQFLSYQHNGRTFIKSTTDLKTKEFESYMEDCRRFASMELSCYVPLPNEPHNFYYDMVA